MSIKPLPLPLRNQYFLYVTTTTLLSVFPSWISKPCSIFTLTATTVKVLNAVSRPVNPPIIYFAKNSKVIKFPSQQVFTAYEIQIQIPPSTLRFWIPHPGTIVKLRYAAKLKLLSLWNSQPVLNLLSENHIWTGPTCSIRAALIFCEWQPTFVHINWVITPVNWNFCIQNQHL